MTNEEKRLRIEALESELLSDVTAENFVEKTEALLACDRLYFSYASRYIADDRAKELTPEPTVTPATEPKPVAVPEPEPEPEQDDAPTKDYVKNVLIAAATAGKANVEQCLTAIGYKKLSDVPREKYRELLKLAGCDE